MVSQRLHASRATLSLRCGDAESALSALEAVSPTSLYYPNALRARGLILLRVLHDTRTYVRIYERDVARNAASPVALTRLAHAYSAVDMHREAIETLSRAAALIAQRPGLAAPAAHFARHLGKLLVMCHEFSRAREHYITALASVAHRTGTDASDAVSACIAAAVLRADYAELMMRLGGEDRFAVADSLIEDNLASMGVVDAPLAIVNGRSATHDFDTVDEGSLATQVNLPPFAQLVILRNCVASLRLRAQLLTDEGDVSSSGRSTDILAALDKAAALHARVSSLARLVASDMDVTIAGGYAVIDRRKIAYAPTLRSGDDGSVDSYQAAQHNVDNFEDDDISMSLDSEMRIGHRHMLFGSPFIHADTFVRYDHAQQALSRRVPLLHESRLSALSAHLHDERSIAAAICVARGNTLASRWAPGKNDTLVTASAARREAAVSAKAAYEAALTHVPMLPDALVGLARLHLRAGDAEACRSVCAQLLEDVPGHNEVRAILSDLAARQLSNSGDAHAAPHSPRDAAVMVRDLQSLLNAAPADTNVLYRLVVALERAGGGQRARAAGEAALDAAVTASPGVEMSSGYLYVRGFVARLAGDPSSALKDWSAASRHRTAGEWSQRATEALVSLILSPSGDPVWVCATTPNVDYAVTSQPLFGNTVAATTNVDAAANARKLLFEVPSTAKVRCTLSLSINCRAMLARCWLHIAASFACLPP